MKFELLMMSRGVFLLTTCLIGLIAGPVWSIQSEPTMDKRGLLGVVLDGQYFPQNDDSRNPVGVRISEIQPGLAADRANLLNGDIVLSVNDQTVSSVRELQVAIASKKPGSKIMLTISRGTDVFMRSVTLGDWFDFLVRTPIFGPFQTDVSLRPITQRDRIALQLPVDLEGLFVESISDRSLYQFVFREGMIITSVNSIGLRSPSVLSRSLTAKENVYEYYLNGIYGSFSLLKD